MKTTKTEKLKNKITYLRRKKENLWKDFCALPKKDSFSGLHLAEQLDKTQQELNELEGDKRSSRHYIDID